MLLAGCAPQTEAANKRVVLYCSVDSVYARPLIEKLRAQTGLEIEPIFDTEATKTAGLANKMRAEKARPRADVFWSSALLQTLLMSEDGLLEPYESSAAQDLPPQFRGKDWAGMGVRGRILVSGEAANLESLQTTAKSAKWAHSNPQFGTASDQFAAWSARDGKEAALRFWRASKRNGMRVLPGNGDTASAVANGDLDFGWTDTDDFLAQKREGKTLFTVKTTRDNVLIPGTVSVVKGAPNPENARKLFDAIVSAQNEAALAKQMPGVFSLRKLEEKSNWQSGGEHFEFLGNAPRDDYKKWPKEWREIREELR